MEAVQPTDEVRRVLGDRGEVLPGARVPDVPERDLVRIYEHMKLVRILDGRIATLARDGKVSFHVGSRGEEASHFAVYPLRDDDWVFPSLREHGAWLWRGYSVADTLHQLLGDAADPLSGRQMPGHHSSRAHRMVSISSTVGTHLPQAAGAAHAARITGKDDVAMAFFGAGASSVGAFHVGLNFAGVYRAPVVFVCRNNGRWQRRQAQGSEPADAGTSSRSPWATVAGKAAGYGIPGVRVDGSDILAVLDAAMEAVARARAGDGPTVIEAVIDRPGVMAGESPDDSSTDELQDRSRPRPDGPVRPRAIDPIERLRAHLQTRGLWTEAMERDIDQKHDGEIDRVMRDIEAAGQPAVESLFDDVYQELPWNLAEQRASLRRS